MDIVKDIIIENISVCLADPSKIRFSALIDTDISEILPYLNATIKGAIYSHKGLSLTIVKDGRIITLYPRQIYGGKINDPEDARNIIKWLKELINKTYRDKDTIKPNYERQNRIGPLDIYKLLPGTNCKKCGETSCLAFAVKITNEETNIMRCTPILSAEYSEKRKFLFKLLRNSGYIVPEVFVED